MANIRPLPRLESISREISAVRSHIVSHSGIPDGQVTAIEVNVCSIATECAAILEECMLYRHSRIKRGSLVKRMRKLLGFTYP